MKKESERKCKDCGAILRNQRSDAERCPSCKRKYQNKVSHEIKKENRKLEKKYNSDQQKKEPARNIFREITKNTEKHDLEKIREKMRSIPFYHPTIKENEILKNAIYPVGFNYHGNKNFNKKEYIQNKLKEIGYTEDDFETLKEIL